VRTKLDIYVFVIDRISPIRAQRLIYKLWNEINRNFLPILQRTNGTCIFLHTYGNTNNVLSLKQVCEKILVNVIKLNDSIWLTIYQFRLN
jgi:hypothetical protein